MATGVSGSYKPFEGFAPQLAIAVSSGTANGHTVHSSQNLRTGARARVDRKATRRRSECNTPLIGCGIHYKART